MTEPNQATLSDMIAARERVIAKNHPAHAGDIRAGKWDNWNAIQSELAEMIRERVAEEAGDS